MLLPGNLDRPWYHTLEKHEGHVLVSCTGQKLSWILRWLYPFVEFDLCGLLLCGFKDFLMAEEPSRRLFLFWCAKSRICILPFLFHSPVFFFAWLSVQLSSPLARWSTRVHPWVPAFFYQFEAIFSLWAVTSGPSLVSSQCKWRLGYWNVLWWK